MEHETSSPNLRFVSKSNDRTVVVTGASTGIGAACVRHLAEHGYRVFATVRKESDAEGISAFDHPRLSPLMLDVTVSDSIEAAVKKVEAEVGGAGLSGLVNNAGISVDVPLEFGLQKSERIVGIFAARRVVARIANRDAPAAGLEQQRRLSGEE